MLVVIKQVLYTKRSILLLHKFSNHLLSLSISKRSHVSGLSYITWVICSNRFSSFIWFSCLIRFAFFSCLSLLFFSILFFFFFSVFVLSFLSFSSRLLYFLIIAFTICSSGLIFLLRSCSFIFFCLVGDFCHFSIYFLSLCHDRFSIRVQIKSLWLYNS